MHVSFSYRVKGGRKAAEMKLLIVAAAMLAVRPADAALRVAKGHQQGRAVEAGAAAMPNGCKNRNGPPPCFKVKERKADILQA